MKLVLKRDYFSLSAVSGVLYVDGVEFCHTLEPAIIDGYGKGSCVKPGTYSIDYHFSPKFGKYMLTLCGVKGRSGILIHSGNVPQDSAGCILVGDRLSIEYLTNSRVLLSRLLGRVLDSMQNGSVTITIKD